MLGLSAAKESIANGPIDNTLSGDIPTKVRKRHGIITHGHHPVDTRRLGRWTFNIVNGILLVYSKATVAHR